MTLGESRVRTTFNPTNNTLVDKIKQDTARLINLCHEMPKPENEHNKAEFLRLTSLAKTAYEEAAMWAVKAATIES